MLVALHVAMSVTNKLAASCNFVLREVHVTIIKVTDDFDVIFWSDGSSISHNVSLLVSLSVSMSIIRLVCRSVSRSVGRFVRLPAMSFIAVLCCW